MSSPSCPPGGGRTTRFPVPRFGGSGGKLAQMPAKISFLSTPVSSPPPLLPSPRQFKLPQCPRGPPNCRQPLLAAQGIARVGRPGGPPPRRSRVVPNGPSSGVPVGLPSAAPAAVPFAAPGSHRVARSVIMHRCTHVFGRTPSRRQGLGVWGGRHSEMGWLSSAPAQTAVHLWSPRRGRRCPPPCACCLHAAAGARVHARHGGASRGGDRQDPISGLGAAAGCPTQQPPSPSHGRHPPARPFPTAGSGAPTAMASPAGDHTARKGSTQRPVALLCLIRASRPRSPCAAPPHTATVSSNDVDTSRCEPGGPAGAGSGRRHAWARPSGGERRVCKPERRWARQRAIASHRPRLEIMHALHSLKLPREQDTVAGPELGPHMAQPTPPPTTQPHNHTHTHTPHQKTSHHLDRNTRLGSPLRARRSRAAPVASSSAHAGPTP